jgi:hypothetical protein
MTCVQCHDERWVCENHPDTPWGIFAEDCFCAAPGAPCPSCNDSDSPAMPPGSVPLLVPYPSMN